MKIEEANIVKYLGTIVTKDNLIEEEIKERTAAGNRAFFANKKIFQSKLVSKKSKIKLYNTIIKTNSNIWFRMLGLNGKYQAETIGFRKEDIEKDIRSNTEGKWRVETQNK
jgi:hypothetical protein